jgi:hypothetical protein
MERRTRCELVGGLRERYRQSDKRAKTKILDEFVAITGHHRKYAVRLLNKSEAAIDRSLPEARCVYGEAVKEALIVLWEASDRICGKRLKAILPLLLESMARHGQLKLEAAVRELLLAMSAATIDRLLRPIRTHAKPRNRRRPIRKTRNRISVRTFADWEEAAPGDLEIDFVAHCGGSLTGSFIHSLVVTDVCSGWTEATPLLMREQSLVVEGLEVLRGRIPIPVLGINSDNDSAFINDSVLTYCSGNAIAFTRSRPYRKNDQAWIEQKNGAVIRRFTGYGRYSGAVAGQTLSHLYGNLRLYVNFFQPSFKLLKKERDGAKVKKSYSQPTTPCDRLLEHPGVDIRVKELLRAERDMLDPMALLHRMRQAQSALASLASSGEVTDQQAQELDQFLAHLPRLWKQGEARPTHRKAPAQARDWRTRKDPFEGVWSDILAWLEKEPDATAKSLFERLQRERPGMFQDSQLRTLQRRVRQWRHIMAKTLVYGTAAS